MRSSAPSVDSPGPNASAGIHLPLFFFILEMRLSTNTSVAEEQLPISERVSNLRLQEGPLLVLPDQTLCQALRSQPRASSDTGIQCSEREHVSRGFCEDVRGLRYHRCAW
jgi:hypothetical protein